MDDYTLPFWIYLGVLTVFVGGAMKKILASHLSTASTLVAWLGATMLVERLWAFCLPAVLLLALLSLACCLYFATGTSSPPPTLPTQGKAVFITGKRRFLTLTQVFDYDWTLKLAVCTIIQRCSVNFYFSEAWTFLVVVGDKPCIFEILLF